MDLLVAARLSLLRALPMPGQDALLLEGSWAEPVGATRHQALDDTIDGRFVWIDVAAAELAEAAGGMGGLPALGGDRRMTYRSRHAPRDGFPHAEREVYDENRRVIPR